MASFLFILLLLSTLSFLVFLFNKTMILVTQHNLSWPNNVTKVTASYRIMMWLKAA